MATANHVLLRRITLTASASSVTFDSIPQTGYTDLKLVVSARSTASADIKGSYYTISCNGASSYAAIYLQGNGTVTGSGTLATLAGVANSNSGTANTFCNDEVYIPNYTSTTAKSYSVDSVDENNASGAYVTLTAGSFASSTAINSITFAPSGSESFMAGSSFSLYGIANATTTPTLAPKADGGDIIKNDGTYWYHAFLSTGSFRPQLNLTCDVVAVAGGGAGGNSYGGGGGAGGVIYFTNQSVASSAATTVTVGAGGAGFTGGTVATGANGSNSTFGALAAAIGGGGGGGYAGNEAGRNGGSGGGGSRATAGGGSSIQTGTGATAYYGNAGGGVGSSNQCAGGGGAGAAGTAGGSTTGGNGGNGTSAFSSWLSTVGVGQNVSGTWYIAGGGSGNGTGAWGVGGYGGGGDGSISKLPTVNCGGGGFDNNVSGSSGVVIIRYPVA